MRHVTHYIPRAIRSTAWRLSKNFATSAPAYGRLGPLGATLAGWGKLADRSSRQPDLLKNADGSVDLYFSSTAPKGFEKNWIPTVPGQAWFTYLRLYAPTEAYFDKTWKLPDIVKVKWPWFLQSISVRFWANAYQFGGTSLRLLAKTFGTSLATVQRCVRVSRMRDGDTLRARHRMNSNLQPVDFARYYSVLIRKPISYGRIRAGCLNVPIQGVIPFCIPSGTFPLRKARI